MNRKNLTAAVLAGLAGAAGIVGSAQAVNINPDGLGQVLIYPYYTVNGGNNTLLSVVNTTGDAKAVKVRFMEGENTREVLDFNLYLSAYDVWTAAIYDDAGTPTLATNDTSCTVPYIYGNGGTQAFLPYAMIDKDPEVADDISRTAEGHFEMIEMGTMIDEESEILDDSVTPPVSFVPPKFGPTNGSAVAATHDATGTPADCAHLVDAWTQTDSLDPLTKGYWLQDSFTDMEAPSGGLFGGAAVINVSDGTLYSYDAKAINGFASSVAADDDLHQEPGTVFPSLNSGDDHNGIVFLDDGTILQSGWLNRGVDAVSFVFMHDNVLNEYTTEAAIAGATEWVITFPTKHFYVYQPSSGDAPPIAPFTSTWEWTAAVPDDPTTGEDESKEAFTTYPCEVVALNTIWDREEQTLVPPDAPVGTPIPPIVSPAPPPVPGVDPDGIIPFELCFETNVITFGAEVSIDPLTSILGSRNTTNIDNEALGFEFGWARINMVDATSDTDGSGAIESDEVLIRQPLGGLYGLPVTGFAVQRFQNGFLGDGADVLANYGGIFQHKATRTTSSGSNN